MLCASTPAEGHAGEIDPSNQCTLAIEHLVLPRPRRQTGQGEAALNEPLEPAVRYASRSVGEQPADESRTTLTGTVQALGGLRQPLDVMPAPLEVVNSAKGGVLADPAGDVADRSGQTSAGNPVDFHNVASVDRSEVLNELRQAAYAASSCSDHFDRWWCFEPIQPV